MMRSLAFLSCVRAFTAPKTIAQRALALRAGDAPDDKTLFALGVNVATQLNDIRTLFKKEEIPKIVEGITAYLSKEVVDPKPVLVEQGNAINQLIQQRMASAIDDEKARGAEAVACLLYTSPSPRDGLLSRMPSSA